MIIKNKRHFLQFVNALCKFKNRNILSHIPGQPCIFFVALSGESAECRKATLCPTPRGIIRAEKGVRRGAGVSPSVAIGIAAASRYDLNTKTFFQI